MKQAFEVLFLVYYVLYHKSNIDYSPNGYKINAVFIIVNYSIFIFQEADEDSSGTLDLEEFKNVFKHFLGLKGAVRF